MTRSGPEERQGEAMERREERSSFRESTLEKDELGQVVGATRGGLHVMSTLQLGRVLSAANV